MIKQDELYDLFVDEDGFDKDFEFLGEDGNVYTFDVRTFDYYCKNYGQSNITDCIQGDLEGMTSRNICRLSNAA
jgi:hypothetical protein